MPRNYEPFAIDSDIPGRVVLKIQQVIDDIMDVNDREHVAFCASQIMQTIFYMGAKQGMTDVSLTILEKKLGGVK